MGYNLLRHASFNLYNNFNTHEAEYHDTIFNYCSDALRYMYVRMCVRVCERACVCLNIFLVNI